MVDSDVGLLQRVLKCMFYLCVTIVYVVICILKFAKALIPFTRTV